MIPTRRTVDAEKLKQYMAHLPTCNIAQDWTEAEQAMADTPQKFRDFSYNEAYQEMITKKNTCTCGLEELLSTPPIEASAGSMTVEMAKDEVAKKAGGENWKELMSRTNIQDSDVEQVAELYASSQFKRIEELEKEISELKIESTDICNCLWHMTKKAEKLQSELSDSREDAIEFAEWISNNKYTMVKNGDSEKFNQWYRNTPSLAEKAFYTTSELFEEFLASKQKQ